MRTDFMFCHSSLWLVWGNGLPERKQRQVRRSSAMVQEENSHGLNTSGQILIFLEVELPGLADRSDPECKLKDAS